MKNFLFEFFKICIVVILQVSMINVLFAPINYINFPIAIIIIYIFTGQYSRSLYWSFFIGLLLSLFAYNRFGIDALAFLFIAVILNILFNNFFSNASYVSLVILGIIAHCINILMVWLFHLLIPFMRITSMQYEYIIDFKLILYQIFTNIIFILFSYKLYLLYNSKIRRGSVYAK